MIMDSRFVRPKKFLPKKGFIPDRKIVNAILLNEKGEVVLFKRGKKNIFYPGYFHILTEKLEKGEDPIEGLKRGVFEETGLRVSKKEIFKLGEKEFTKWNGGCNEVESFCVLIKEGDIKLNREHSEYLLVRFGEVENLKITPVVEEMLKRLEKFSPLDL